MSLPEGWKWKEPREYGRPWCAVREDDVKITVEGPTQLDVVDTIIVTEAGRAALDHRARKGWAFNHHSGFVD